MNTANRKLADTVLRELDAYADRVGDPFVRAWQVIATAARLDVDGEFERAIEVAERFGVTAAGLGIEAVGQALSTLATVEPLIELGRFEQALAGRWSYQFLLHGDAVYTRHLAIAGQREDARNELQRIMGARKIGPDNDWTDVPTLVLLLEAAVLLGDADAAGVLSERVDSTARPFDFRGSPGRLQGLAALLRGDLQTARTHLDRALKVAQAMRARPEVARTHVALAQVLFAEVDRAGAQQAAALRAEAGQHLDVAIREFRAMKMQPWLEQALRLKMTRQGIASSDFKTSIDAVASVVQREQPDLRSHAAPDGTVTILFSDIEGSTQMTERLGDQRWLSVLREHNRIVREQVAAHGGFEVKSQGDGFMIAFQSARRAVQCAIAIQRAFAAHDAEHTEEPLRVRIGLHAGEVIKEADDFFGKNVILAARIAAQAQGGEILVSSLVKELTQSSGDMRFEDARATALKGLTGTYTLHPVQWVTP